MQLQIIPQRLKNQTFQLAVGVDRESWTSLQTNKLSITWENHQDALDIVFGDVAVLLCKYRGNLNSYQLSTYDPFFCLLCLPAGHVHAGTCGSLITQSDYIHVYQRHDKWTQPERKHGELKIHLET